MRASAAVKVGVVYSQDGCRMYCQDIQGETTGCQPLPVQFFSGPEQKIAYDAEFLRRALMSCGAGATIEVSAGRQLCFSLKITGTF